MAGRSLLRLGFFVGVLFGLLNVRYSWLYPLADDTPIALLAFYGPMFSVWSVVAFFATRRTGSVQGAPLKIGVASVIGAVMGLIGGALGRLAYGRHAATASPALASHRPAQRRPRKRTTD